LILKPYCGIGYCRLVENVFFNFFDECGKGDCEGADWAYPFYAKYTSLLRKVTQEVASTTAKSIKDLLDRTVHFPAGDHTLLL